MTNQPWLPLTEYSSKYRVSISTLRRRIKAGDLECKLEEGKYLLRDRPNQEPNEIPKVTQAPPHKLGHLPEVRAEELTVADEASSPLAVTANRLLNELKKAYSLILQEKEEQVLQLRDEVADLKTLVKVLEEEVERLRGPKDVFRELAREDDWLAHIEK